MSRGCFLLWVSCDFTGDERAKVLGGDYGSPAHPRYAQPSCGYVIVNGGPAQTGRLTGLADAITELRGIVLDGLHCFGPIWSVQECAGLHGTKVSHPRSAKQAGF